MGRNKKNRKVQVRKRTKNTTGQYHFTDVVYMDKEVEIVDGKRVEKIFSVCTCGKFRSSEEANTITKVAREAQAHVKSGECRLRKHDVPQEMEDRPDSEEIEEMREEALRAENGD